MLYMPLYTAIRMGSTRTQIYLTADQRKRLDELAKREGNSLAELIREAVDCYLAEKSPPKIDLQAHLDRFFGSMPDLADAVVAEGFARLAALLAEVPRTDDAITDLAGLGRAYLVNARQNPHLYAVMFGSVPLARRRFALSPFEEEPLRTFVRSMITTAGRASGTRGERLMRYTGVPRAPSTRSPI